MRASSVGWKKRIHEIVRSSKSYYLSNFDQPAGVSQQVVGKIVLSSFPLGKWVKLAGVGSSDQRNTIWSTVELEGDRDGTYGTSGLVSGPESGSLASMETGTVIKRDI
jgi:hypothetical protein